MRHPSKPVPVRLRNPCKAKSILLKNFENFTLPYIPYLIPRFMCFYPQRLSTTHVIPNQTCSRCAGGLQAHCLSCFPLPGELVSLAKNKMSSFETLCKFLDHSTNYSGFIQMLCPPENDAQYKQCEALHTILSIYVRHSPPGEILHDGLLQPLQ